LRRRFTAVEEQVKLCRCQSRFRMGHDRGNYGDAVRAGVNYRRGIVTADAADGDQRDSDLAPRFCQQLYPGKVHNLLAACRVDGAETDVIGPGCNGGKRFGRVVGRDADKSAVAQPLPCCCRRSVIPAEVNTVGIKGSGQLNIVIDDKEHARLAAETAQFRAESEFLCRSMLLRAELYSADMIQRRTDPCRQLLPMIGDQVRSVNFLGTRCSGHDTPDEKSRNTSLRLAESDVQGVVLTASLRRYYPDQVFGVRGTPHLSSCELPQLA